MPRAKTICPKPGCPHVAIGRYCAEHNKAYEKRRGTPAQRGYGTEHKQMRATLEPYVMAGQADCWRCGKPIKPGEQWDLGHDDNDRTKYAGPEHANQCNRAAAGRSAHRPGGHP